MPFCYTFISLHNTARVLDSLQSSGIVMSVDEQGEILEEKVSVGGLSLTIRENCAYPSTTLKGSLSKGFHGHSRGRFFYSDLVQWIADFCRTVGVSPSDCFIHSLELQVNLFINESPTVWVQSAIAHKGSSFVPTNSRNPNIGRIANHDRFAIKIYDKYKADMANAYSKQDKLRVKESTPHKNILRVGVSVSKMQYFNNIMVDGVMTKGYDINTLADLLDIEKVIALTTIVYDEMNSIKFIDSDSDVSVLTPKQQNNFSFLCNPYSWDKMNAQKKKGASRLLDRLKNKIKHRNFNVELVGLCFAEYVQIFESETGEKRPHLHHLQQAFEKCKSDKMTPFAHLVSNVQMGSGLSNTLPTHEQEKTAQNSPSKNALNHKKCMICGNDISMQKSGSKYCSEKQYGLIARKCRNKAGNRRQTEKRKLQIENELQLLEHLKGYNCLLELRFIVSVREKERIRKCRPVAEKLKTWNKERIMKIKDIRIIRHGLLTTVRAKNLVRFIQSLKS